MSLLIDPRDVQDDTIHGFNHGGWLSNYDFEHDQDRLEAANKATDLFEEKTGLNFLAGWHELIAMYRSIRQTDMVKLVVIDLDDTLWRGVVAELDPDALPTAEGWPTGFWEALAFLKRRGILLAIISKNEESRVRAVWDRILGRQVRLDDFAIHRINWRPKAENMAEILAHVNLLPRNVVYIDDNPAERAAIKAVFPDIRVLGGTPLTWRRILLWSPETQVPAITAESAARTEMVRAQVTREEHRQTLPREAFLASLDVRMQLFEVSDVGHPRFGRVLELINKTNQFNTTGRRWTREECGAAFAAGTTCYAFEVADLYTEYGLVGVLLVDAEGIRQFVMSCRILGLEAEIAAVARIVDMVRTRGGATVFAAMVETDRNLPCRDLYARCGFTAADGGWQRAVDPPLPVPAHITLTDPTSSSLSAAGPRDPAQPVQRGRNELEYRAASHPTSEATLMIDDRVEAAAPWTRVDFSEGGNSAAFRGQGWSGQEQRFVWTIGNESELIFEPAPQQQPLLAKLSVGPFIAPPALAVQRLTVLANDHEIGSFELAKAETLECAIPAAAVADQERLRLAFRHPDAASPAETKPDNTDARQLAVAFFSVELLPMTAAAEPVAEAPEHVEPEPVPVAAAAPPPASSAATKPAVKPSSGGVWGALFSWAGSR